MSQPARHSTARVLHDNIVQIMVVRAIWIVALVLGLGIGANLHRAGDKDRDLKGA